MILNARRITRIYVNCQTTNQLLYLQSQAWKLYACSKCRTWSWTLPGCPESYTCSSNSCKCPTTSLDLWITLVERLERQIPRGGSSYLCTRTLLAPAVVLRPYKIETKGRCCTFVAWLHLCGFHICIIR